MAAAKIIIEAPPYVVDAAVRFDCAHRRQVFDHSACSITYKNISPRQVRRGDQRTRVKGRNYAWLSISNRLLSIRFRLSAPLYFILSVRSPANHRSKHITACGLCRAVRLCLPHSPACVHRRSNDTLSRHPTVRPPRLADMLARKGKRALMAHC